MKQFESCALCGREVPEYRFPETAADPIFDCPECACFRVATVAYALQELTPVVRAELAARSREAKATVAAPFLIDDNLVKQLMTSPGAESPADSDLLRDQLKGETTEHADPSRLEDEGQSGG